MTNACASSTDSSSSSSDASAPDGRLESSQAPGSSSSPCSSGEAQSPSEASCASPAFSPKPLPELLTPLVPERPSLTQVCACCRRILPHQFFAQWSEGPKRVLRRHRYCNRCRAKRLETSPQIERKRRLLEQRRSRPCAQCGAQHEHEIMHLVHARGERTFYLANRWRFLSDPDLYCELEKYDTYCPVCYSRHRREQIEKRRQMRATLADVQLEIEKVHGLVDSPPVCPR